VLKIVIMNPETDGTRRLLRALAEVRDGPFYSLSVGLQKQTAATGEARETPMRVPFPEIGFRIYQCADSEEAWLVIGVSAVRKDGIEITWSVGVQTAPDALKVIAAIENSDDQGTSTLHERSAAAANPLEASVLVRAYAQEICSQRQWFDDPVTGSIG